MERVQHYVRNGDQVQVIGIRQLRDEQKTIGDVGVGSGETLPQLVCRSLR